jgi:Fur family ferric uptake transcriptional regulator
MQQLAARGFRNTVARRTVIETILNTEGQLTARALHETLLSREIGRATIYRALELLVELGVLDRLHVDERCSSYVACADRHHHHVICERCGMVREVGDARIEQVIRAIAADSGLRAREHRLEIVGVCIACEEDQTRTL